MNGRGNFNRGMAALAVLLLADGALAQQAVLPFAVVRDNDMGIIGPVVSTIGADGPIIRIKDPITDGPVFLEVRDDNQLIAITEATYFSESSCTGTPYHNNAFNEATKGFAALTGFAYSVARQSGTQRLFRSQVSVTESDVGYQSWFRSSVDGCDARLGTLTTGQQAIEVENLDSTFPPPYLME